jgi:site-specific DNA-methyltransferase (adenine-specific)
MIEISNEDNMQLMARYPDNYFDLAIVDPPYGIGAGSKKFINGTSKTKKDYYKENDWDDAIPKKEYFDELFRVSKNQVIWGGNYFTDFLKPSRCWIFWDKTIHGNSYADGELAWTSFDKVVRYYRQNICQIEVEGKRSHPTQKAIKLYTFILQNFANAGDKILDTHIGSGSIAIAVDNANKIDKMNLTLVGCELDKDYYNATMKRIKEQTSWRSLF